VKLPLTIALLFALKSNAATYYAATNGNDSADGSIGTPWRTVKKAVETISGGDTIQLRSGWFIETNWPPTWASGSAGSVKTLMAYPGESVRISQSSNQFDLIRLTDVDYWTFCDLTLDNHLAATNAAGGNVVKLTSGGSDGAHHNTFSNCVLTAAVRGHLALVNGGSSYNLFTYVTFTNVNTLTIEGDSPPHAIYLQSPTNTIDHCLFAGGGSYDLDIHNFAPEADGTVVRYCTFTSDHKAIGFIKGDGCLAYNCLVIGGDAPNAAGSIGDNSVPCNGSRISNVSVYGYSTGFQIYGSTNSIIENIIVGACDAEGWALSVDNNAAVSGAVFRNVVVDSAFRGFDIYGLLYITNSTALNIYTNVAAGFLNPPGDLRISATSYAVDKGLTSSGFADDFSGAARPFGSAWDIGAYEYFNASQIQTANLGTLNLR